MNPQERNLRNFLAAVASLCTIGGTLWPVLAPEERWTWPCVLLLTGVVSLAVMLRVSPDSVSLKCRVRRACKLIKLRAAHTIDIAAGDCSWLGAELADLRGILQTKGIELRMVCEETANPSYLANVETLAGLKGSEVRRFGEESLLRCIIIDRDNKSRREMLLLERKSTANEIFSLVRVPEPLQRGHIARVIEPDSRLFDVICLAYEYLYQNAKPLAAV